MKFFIGFIQVFFGLMYGRESFSQNCEATAVRSAIKKNSACYIRNCEIFIITYTKFLSIAPLLTVPTRLAVKIKC